MELKMASASDTNKELVKIISSEDYQGNKVIDIKGLLEEGADVDFQDEDQGNMTLLQLAISKNESNIVKLLVEHGASVHGNSDDEESPLKLAKRLGMSDAIQFLNVCLRLDSYVKSMVELFLSKLKDYEKEIQPGNNVVKSGKTAGGVAAAVEGASAAVPVVGSKGIGKLTGKIATYVGEKQHRRKAKTIEAVLFSFDEDRRKNIIALASLEIFRSFEKQFSEITGENGNWQRDLEKLGEDAVNRVTNYIATSKEAFSTSLITKGVILGESKEGFTAAVTPKKVQSLKKMPKPGHTVHVQDEKWNTSELYKSAGVVEIKENSRCYYKLKTGDKSGKYGYRLAFDWETEMNGQAHLEFQPNFQPDQDYKYSLESINLHKMAANIVKVIDSGDLLKIASGTKKAVDNAVKKVDRVKITLGRLEVAADRVEMKVDTMKGTIEQFLKQNAPKNPKAIKFGVNRLVTPYTERADILNNISTNINDFIVVVTGLAGVGKSELSNRYIDEYFDNYDSIIVVDASSSKSFKNSFYDLSSEMGIDKYDASGELKNMKCIIKEVFDSAKEAILFVFDNAESFSTVREFLQIATLPVTKKPHILITSLNNCEWTSDRLKIKIFSLQEFTNAEASTFVKEALGIIDETQNEFIEKLTLKLHNFPLALRQAVTFIKQERQYIEDDNFSIKDYLKKYEECTSLCLDYRPANDAYIKTVYKTFCLTAQTIEKSGKNGHQALKILDIMPYFASTNIPIDILKNKLVCDDPSNFRESVKLLEDYSLVGVIKARQDEKKLKIHGLVQEVRRIELREKGLEENLLNISLELLTGHVCDRGSVRCFRPHFISLWNHAYCYPNLVKRYFVNGTTRNNELSNNENVSIAEWCSDDVFKTILQKNANNATLDTAAASPLSLEILIVAILSPETTNVKTNDYHGVSDSNWRIIKLLFSNKSTADNRRLFTPLHYAAGEGYFYVVNLLLEKDVSVDPITVDKYTPLHLAARSGHQNIVDILLKRGANLNAVNNVGYTPLHFAALRGHSDIVSALLENKVDVDARDKHKETPLHVAVVYGHVDVVEILLANGADKNAANNDRHTPLHAAALISNTDMVATLLKNNVSVDARDKDEETPLHQAANYDNADVVKLLLLRGANPNAFNNFGYTPLHRAISMGHTNVVVTLLERAVDGVDALCAIGQTPLHVAVISGRVNIVQILLARGADRNALDCQDHTPLQTAVLTGNTDVVATLIENGVDVNALNKRGDTSLHTAVHCRRVNVVKILLVHGADRNAVNNNGITPLETARLMYHTDLVAALTPDKNRDVIALMKHLCTCPFLLVKESLFFVYLKLKATIITALFGNRYWR